MQFVTLLEGFELAAGEQIHATEQREPSLDELGSSSVAATVSLFTQLGYRRLRIVVVALAEEALGVADPAFETPCAASSSS